MIAYILLPFQAVGIRALWDPVTMANHCAAQNYNVRGLNWMFSCGYPDNCRGCDPLSLRNSRFVSQLPPL